MAVTDISTEGFAFAGATDVGRWRKANQDHWHVDPELGLAVVADGMGGHIRGEEASRLAIDALFDAFRMAHEMALEIPLERPLERPPEADMRTPRGATTTTESAARAQLTAAIAAANERVHTENAAAGLGEGAGMGTTLTGLLRLDDEHALAFNIGDSRLYRWRSGALELLTEDHTLYRAWERSGRQGPAPPRNIILRAIGLHRDVEAELTSVDIAAQDRFLLCSDGLCGMVPDARIASLLAAERDASPERLCEQLVEAANAAGGEDNITVVILTPRP